MQDIEGREVKDPAIVILKSERVLKLFVGDQILKTYPIVLGSSPTGSKEVEGDGKTPEGEFYIFTRNPRSKFRLSLGISYPSTHDAGRGLAERLITQDEHDEILRSIADRQMPPQKTKLGGEIYIHGGGTKVDWTDGCIAMSDEMIDELFAVIPVGTPVTILP